MKTETKALIITSWTDDDQQHGADQLNQHFAEGWALVHSCPMPSAHIPSTRGYPPTCLVVIQRVAP